MFNENLFSERFLIKSTRLKNWDYSKSGYYFLTICTINRINYFGHINDGKMILSDIGEIANQCWRKIPNHFPHVKLDEFVVMPNHVHGIVRMVETQNNKNRRDAITKSIPFFYWQSRYYEHIIRDKNALWRIRNYIKNNPIKWHNDRNHRTL